MPKIKLRNAVAESPDKILYPGIHDVTQHFVDQHRDSGVIEKILEEDPVSDDQEEVIQEEVAVSNKKAKEPKNKKGDTQDEK